MINIEQAIVAFANWIWNTPLLILLLGGGLFFLIYSGFVPFRYIGHAINILRGRYDNPDDPGQINHFQALSTALAATVGMGNISGVAIAIALGGPGAIFWMWVTAVVGMATKFFTAIPTMTAALLLAPQVKKAAKDYFSRMKSSKIII